MTRVLLLITSFLLLASHALADIALADVDASRQTELMYLLKHDCGSCHGMTLKGGLGPALLPEALAGKPAEFLVNTILEGRPNTAMPPWKNMLSHEDAEWLTAQMQQGIK